MQLLSLVPSETQNSGFLKFMSAQNVAVAAARIKILSPPPTCSYVPHCASCENVAVAPARINISKSGMAHRTLLSSKSSKHDSNYQHYWNSWFLLFIIQLHFCANNASNSKHSWSSWFCLFLTTSNFSSYFKRKPYILLRWCFLYSSQLSPRSQFWWTTQHNIHIFRSPQINCSHVGFITTTKMMKFMSNYKHSWNA